MIYQILLLLFGILLYYGLYKPTQFFQQKSIKTIKGILPLIGNCKAIILRRRNFFDLADDWYKEYPSERYNGVYRFTLPMLMIRDIELIKKIGIKDFDHFADHTSVISEETDPIIGKSLISLNGDRWRNMRATLSPAFTTSKMRAMFELMNDCAANFCSFFSQKAQDVEELEFKATMTKFTNDVIASTAFGVTINSLKDPDNEFYKMGQEATNITGVRMILMFIPLLAKILGMKLFPASVEKFFQNVIVNNIEQRESKGIIRNDMIQLLMEAKKGRLKHERDQSDNISSFAAVEESEIGKDQREKKELSDDDIVAQALLFFFAGFDTVSTTSCFMAHELAVHTDIQEKLYNEIEDVQQKYNGKLTYDSIMQMKYLDQVTSETLRKWTPAAITDRYCLKDYVIEPVLPSEKTIIIRKGETVMFPIIGIHRDPKYYPDPNKFNPDRFNDENKSKIIPGSYLPFGTGPRNCIGSRFALLEIKTLFFHLLLNFELIVIDKTQVPLKLSPGSAFPIAENGFWLGLRKRK